MIFESITNTEVLVGAIEVATIGVFYFMRNNKSYALATKNRADIKELKEVVYDVRSSLKTVIDLLKK